MHNSESKCPQQNHLNLATVNAILIWYKVVNSSRNK